MWTATIVSKEYSKGALLIGVTYTDGVTTFSEAYNISSSFDVDTIVNSKLEGLNKVSDVVPDVTLGNFTPAQTGPSVAEQDFLDKLALLEKALKAVSLGLIPDTDQIYTDALFDAKKAFKSDFLRFL